MEATTDLRSSSDRERILRAMTELCARCGYAETTVEGVIERAGVSREVFSALYRDKEACVVDAHAAILQEVMTIVADSYSPDRSEWESARAGIRALLELFAARPSVAAIGLIVARQTGPAGMSANYDAGVRAVCAMLDRGRTADQPALTARGALGGPEAVARREAVAGRTERLLELFPDFIYGATVPFLGQEEALRQYRLARDLLA